MKPKVGLITLGVRDLAASLRFYRDGLGWPTHGDNPDADIVFFSLEGTWLALYPREKLAEDWGAVHLWGRQASTAFVALLGSVSDRPGPERP